MECCLKRKKKYVLNYLYDFKADMFPSLLFFFFTVLTNFLSSRH